MLSQPKKKKVKVGLALGGGGARGLAHIGVLKALEQAGVKIDYIAGTSMGAFMGACYSVGLKIDEIEKEALSFDKRKAMSKLVDVALPQRSILKGKKAYDYIDNLLKQADFSDAKIPLRIIATNLANGEEVTVTEGKIAKAIKASICVPGIFPPVKINDQFLVDGGVANPTPVDQVVKMGADIVIGVDLVLKRSVLIEKEPNLISTLLLSYDVIRSKSVNLCESKEGCKVIIIKPEVNNGGVTSSFKFYDIGKFIDAGEKATKEKLPEIIRAVRNYKK